MNLIISPHIVAYLVVFYLLIFLLIHKIMVCLSTNGFLESMKYGSSIMQRITVKIGSTISKCCRGSEEGESSSVRVAREGFALI